jgi:hypothetical protein
MARERISSMRALLMRSTSSRFEKISIAPSVSDGWWRSRCACCEEMSLSMRCQRVRLVIQHCGLHTHTDRFKNVDKSGVVLSKDFSQIDVLEVAFLSSSAGRQSVSSQNFAVPSRPRCEMPTCLYRRTHTEYNPCCRNDTLTDHNWALFLSRHRN